MKNDSPDEANPKPSYIYFILNKVNGKYYVGQTSFSLEKRWEEHVRDSRKRNNTYHLYSALRKYGKYNFEVRLLFTCYDQKSLDEAEKYFIKFFDATNHEYGYNNRLGGEGGRHSEVSRKKMSAVRTGKIQSPETKAKIGAWNKGKKRSWEQVEATRKKLLGRKRPPFSEEWRANITKSALGKKDSPQTKQNKKEAALKREAEKRKRLNGRSDMYLSQ